MTLGLVDQVDGCADPSEALAFLAFLLPEKKPDAQCNEDQDE